MTNERIIEEITVIRDRIAILETNIAGLFEELKKNYPIQPGDKVRVTQKGAKHWNTGKQASDTVQEGQCTELEIHWDDTVRAICYPFKKDGTVAKTGKIWISHDTTIEKI